MQTYIKLTPHFLENLQKFLGLFKKSWFLVKQMMFIQQKDWFYSKKTCFLMIFVKKCLVNHFFPSTNLPPYTFWERFSHANVNEFDDWRAPSHCKTFGFIFRKWIGMGKPKWLINSGLDCIFLQIGVRKKKKVMDGLWDWQPFSFLLKAWIWKLQNPKFNGKFQVWLCRKCECWAPQVIVCFWSHFFWHKCQGWRAPGDC